MGVGNVVGGSISFDHAADSYDATRAVGPEIDAKRTAAILTELNDAGADRLLEVGIGTGRIARPIAEEGVRVTGVDISSRMMAQLRRQLGEQHLRPDLILGDATRLPLADASFSAGLLVHVLHLVSDWRVALDEIRRVFTPGAVLLHDATRYDDNNPWQRTFQKREELVAELGVTLRSRPQSEEIRSRLEDIGASLRMVTYAEDDVRDIAKDILQRTRDRVDSWTWEIPEDVYPEFLARYEAYLDQEIGLDFEYTTHVTYSLEVWHFP